MTDRLLTVLAALNLFVAVGAGAFGAHGLKRVVGPDLLAVWQTGVQYHMIHALGLLGLALLTPRFASGYLTAAGWLMLLGILLFSGSLYALTLTGVRGLGAITPFGGVAFLAAWLLVAWSAWKGPTL